MMVHREPQGGLRIPSKISRRGRKVHLMVALRAELRQRTTASAGPCGPICSTGRAGPVADVGSDATIACRQRAEAMAGPHADGYRGALRRQAACARAPRHDLGFVLGRAERGAETDMALA